MPSIPEVHIAGTSCLLCRQPPIAGSHVFDLEQNLLSVLDCQRPCDGCSYKPYPSAWCHPPCYSVLADSYHGSEEPTIEEFERLAVAIRPVYMSVNKTCQEIASTLEGLLSDQTKHIILMTMIAECIAPCWYLTVLGETRRLIEYLRTNHDTQSPQLSLTRQLWISKINYQGISYVARLSSKPLQQTGASYHMRLPSNIRRMVLSVDDIGLRRIQFVDHDTDPVPDGSPWYEILEVDCPDLKACVNCDGLFVRDIRFVDGSSSSRGIWSTPFPPKFHPWNFFHLGVKPRLDYVKFDLHIRGLLVCCCDAKTIGIHGFLNTGGLFKHFVELMRQRARTGYVHWIYFPLNRHERIGTAWIRKPKGCSATSFGSILILQTSLRRTVTFGPQIPAAIIDFYEYIPLVQDGDGAISGIFHDGLDPVSRYVSAFGVTCNTQRQAGTLRLLPMDTHYELPEVPPGKGSIATTWYMTKASLKGLVKVQVCRDQGQSHQPCLGLLLSYSDEHMESLGQVRWDLDLTQEVLHPVYIEKVTIEGQDYIKDIRSDTLDFNESRAATGEVQKLPRDGTIIWWSGRVGDKILTCNET
ncbi:hypothetical protein BJX96DRAFT_165361 [Aspergillus floccosus]